MKKYLLCFSLISAILFTVSCGASETNTSGVAQIRESDKTAAQAEAKSNNSVEENTTETKQRHQMRAPRSLSLNSKM